VRHRAKVGFTIGRHNGAAKGKGQGMTLTPAYGRDYKSKAEVEADWNGGKDFQIASVGPWMGSYVTKRELVEVGGEKEVNIRYAKLSKVVVLKL
jgi:hypothetical protein